MSYSIKGSDLHLSKSFLKERREKMKWYLECLKNDSDRLLEYLEKGYYISDSDSMALGGVIAARGWINEECNKNYNPKRKDSCPYCKQEFIGIMAYDRCFEHKINAHKKEWDKEVALGVVGMGVVFAQVMDSLTYTNAEWLYEKTKSENAKRIMILNRKGEDIPRDLYEAYQKDHDAYMDTQDPGRKWHEPHKPMPPDSPPLYGRKALNKSIFESIKSILTGKKDAKD